MKHRRLLYLFAILGAGLGVFGDVCGTEAAKGRAPVLLCIVGTLAWACCFPVWYFMSRWSGGGFTKPAALWTVAGTIIGGAVIAYYREPESPAKRALLVVILIAGIAREIVP